ncbi:MAG: cob(I)yrinic acid a,c-diamide adenosyltransferase [Hydrocarboniphaga sp.]|uniref:cob(I)yrinic acid a,c-diamide adenosyltransferase n=1 Tax=Hydrocarboniphaga sp. TaxID=2033016 RepID=UPI00261964D0|nr:cob(I)yrinic acid a,c-diamide adenosyltransferase [Hydrocarboniphaga sp.]MDB5967800.1 cob(I)yrinic acid a,c-diamide adenosyltransferase [Hydrocarboniphaga sp.]
MGNRLSKIVTRTGDKGTTGLSTGDRVPKFDPRVKAMGETDELNSQIGVLLTQKLPADIRATLEREQHTLFNLGGELSMPGAVFLKTADVERLEAAGEALNELLPPLKEFVLPGGTVQAATCHVARAVARRLERQLWELNAAEPLNEELLRYANRMSDYLFIAARTLARIDGATEPTWVKY